MIVECNYCPKQLETNTDDIFFTNSSYGANHPTCAECYINHKDKEIIPDYPVIKKELSTDFKNFLLSLKNITIYYN